MTLFTGYAIIYMGTSKNPFERKRATCTDSCVKPPHRAPARFRSLSLLSAQLSHFLFSKRFLEVPICHIPPPCFISFTKRYERTRDMANIQILKNKIPFIITLFCCVTVAALAASVRAGDEARVQAAAAETVTRQVIVLDAGHPTYLNTQTPRIWLNNAV